MALWADIPDGLGEVVVREVEALQIWAVGLGYVALYGGRGGDLLRTRVAAPPVGVELGDGDRPGAWSAAALGMQIANECRSTEAARQRRRAVVDAARRERRTARQAARA
ncbi:hypothetical protein ACIBBE_45540 [Streptomyces sp. NPDC051644]|uniref:hypothetical protein n=1 Tax=Streptomyces sp. NPDC051644 TaxID=3365666 RepID=UPI003792EFC2